MCYASHKTEILRKMVENDFPKPILDERFFVMSDFSNLQDVLVNQHRLNQTINNIEPDLVNIIKYISLPYIKELTPRLFTVE